jgi:hypothetical protein
LGDGGAGLPTHPRDVQKAQAVKTQAVLLFRDVPGIVA